MKDISKFNFSEKCQSREAQIIEGLINGNMLAVAAESRNRLLGINEKRKRFSQAKSLISEDSNPINPPRSCCHFLRGMTPKPSHTLLMVPKSHQDKTI